MRLLGRGFSPSMLQAITVDQIDVSTPSGRSAILLGMMSYFFIFALLMGGMYLAIDTTAGERERGSLEPLLSLPVTRGRLMLGKIAATCLFMGISLMLSLWSFFFALKFMPLEQLGMTPNFGPAEVIAAFFLLLPFILFDLPLRFFLLPFRFPLLALVFLVLPFGLFLKLFGRWLALSAVISWRDRSGGDRGCEEYGQYEEFVHLHALPEIV